MELAALVGIFVLVWYYGHSLKVASEVNTRVSSELLSELLTIKDFMAQVSKNVADLSKKITDLERLLWELERFADSAGVGWKDFNEKIDAMLQKLDSIGALSVDLDSIHSTLESMERAVDAIAAHPAFTWPRDKD